jgi:hypothetical protein
MIKLKSKRKVLFLAAVVVASIAIIATVVFSSKKQRPTVDHPRKHPKEWLSSVPPVDSQVKDLEIINARIVRAETDAPGVAFEIRNNSNLAVMAVEVKCGDAGISQDGLEDEENPKVIIQPHGTLTAEMNDELAPGTPIVITAATFEDGSEKGRESSIQLMQKLRARERARHKAKKQGQPEQENPHQ